MRSHLINAAIIIIAFIVMLAALRVNPGSTKGDINVSVSGTIVDQQGNPLINADVTCSNIDGHSENYFTDEAGHYNLTVPWLDYFHGICLTATNGYYWYQAANPEYKEGVTQLQINFVLTRPSIVNMPICPMVFATIHDGLTKINKTCYLSELTNVRLNVTNGTPCNYCTGYLLNSPCQSRIFNETATSSSYTYATLNFTVWGGYNIEGKQFHEQYYDAGWVGSDQDNESTYDIRSLSRDYLDPSSVVSNSTFYSLEMGQNVTISSRQYNHTVFPEEFQRVIDVRLPDSNISLSVDAFFCGIEYAMDNGDGGSYASVTINPLTSGTHVYQVYIENEVIIHVWEID